MLVIALCPLFLINIAFRWGCDGYSFSFGELGGEGEGVGNKEETDLSWIGWDRRHHHRSQGSPWRLH
jgi:hypothetical protein